MTENEALDNWIEWQRQLDDTEGGKGTQCVPLNVCVRELWTMSTRAKMDANQTKRQA